MNRSHLSFSALPFLLLACSSSSSSSSGGGGAGDGVVVPSGEAKSGSITVIQQESAGLGGTNLTSDVSATFFATYDPGAAPACTTKRYGECLVKTCDVAGSTDTTQAVPASAGTITVTGLASGVVTLTGSAESYTPADSQFAGFSAGTKIEASAPGDPSGAPAFDVSVTSPDDVVVAAPTFDDESNVAHYHAGDDVPVTWAPIANGQVQVDMINAPGGKLVQVSCTWDGKAGSATIPGSTIGLLGEAGGYDMGFYALTSASQSVSGWQITETLQTRAYGPGKTAFAGGTLELD